MTLKLIGRLSFMKLGKDVEFIFVKDKCIKKFILATEGLHCQITVKVRYFLEQDPPELCKLKMTK